MFFWTSWMDRPLHRVINMGMGQDSRPTRPCETVASPRKPGHRHESVACFLVKFHCLLMKIPKMVVYIYIIIYICLYNHIVLITYNMCLGKPMYFHFYDSL